MILAERSRSDWLCCFGFGCLLLPIRCMILIFLFLMLFTLISWLRLCLPGFSTRNSYPSAVYKYLGGIALKLYEYPVSHETSDFFIYVCWFSPVFSSFIQIRLHYYHYFFWYLNYFWFHQTEPSMAFCMSPSSTKHFLAFWNDKIF